MSGALTPRGVTWSLFLSATSILGCFAFDASAQVYVEQSNQSTKIRHHASSPAYVEQSSRGLDGAYVLQVPRSARPHLATPRSTAPSRQARPTKAQPAKQQADLVRPQPTNASNAQPQGIREVVAGAQGAEGSAIARQVFTAGQLPTVARGVTFILPAEHGALQLPSVGRGTVSR